MDFIGIDIQTRFYSYLNALSSYQWGLEYPDVYDGEAPVLETWREWRIPSLSLLAGSDG